MRPGCGIGLKPIIGTRVMDSTPAQMNASPAFIWMAPAAMWMAYIDEPQKRLTVAPATESGSPARKTTMRATFSPCSPSGKAQPRIRSSMSAASMPVFCHQAPDHLGRKLVGAHLRQFALGGKA